MMMRHFEENKTIQGLIPTEDNSEPQNQNEDNKK